MLRERGKACNSDTNFYAQNKYSEEMYHKSLMTYETNVAIVFYILKPEKL